MTHTHAHFKGEDDEQTKAHVAALEAELAGQKQRSTNEKVTQADRDTGKRRAGEVEDELERITGQKRTRLRGEST